MDEKITPALNLKNEGRSELSADEFQRQLYTWFEDRGLMSELRAHLRMQMIGVLKETPMGRSSTRPGISPKLQALNMLIAEFMLHQEYHYSLCVFSTEVPLINVFPEFSNCILNNTANRHNLNATKWRFSEKDMWDLLETLGIMHNTEEGNSIADMYYSNNEESLLSALVRVLHSMKTMNQMKLNAAEGTSSDQWTLQSITELLSKANIQSHYITQIVEHMKLLLNKENKKFQLQQREEYVMLKARLEEESVLKVLEYKKRMKEVEDIFRLEKQRLEEELHKTKGNLSKCSEVLQTRYDELEERDSILEIRESGLLKREEDVKITKKKLQLALSELYEEKMQVTDLKQKLEAEYRKSNEKEMQKEIGTNGQQNEARNSQFEADCFVRENSRSQVDQMQQTASSMEIENAVLKQTIKQIQLENSNLQNQNRDHQSRVRHLAHNARIIMGDLHNYENRVGGARIGSLNVVGSPVPSMPSLSVRQRSSGIVSNLGSGEEVISPPLPPRYNRVHHPIREPLKKHLRRKPLNNFSSTEEPSTTEEILEEARQRLRNLELESAEIDRNFREYRKRYPEVGLTKDRVSHDSEIKRDTIMVGGKCGPIRMNCLDTSKFRPSTSFGFCDEPTTSAEQIFNFNAKKQDDKRAQSELYARKRCKAVGDYQDKNNPKLNTAWAMWSSTPYFSGDEIQQPNATDAPGEQNGDEDKNSGQSANSSGFLKQVPATSFSTVDVSSDESDSENHKTHW